MVRKIYIRKGMGVGRLALAEFVGAGRNIEVVGLFGLWFKNRAVGVLLRFKILRWLEGGLCNL